MLDPWLEVFPDQWPISGASSRIEDIRKIRQVDMGKAPRLTPRAKTEAVFLENKTVLDLRTGKTVPGGIYEMRAK